MRTEIDLNESEIDLNECEHFLKAKQSWIDLRLTKVWIDLNVNSPTNYYEVHRIKGQTSPKTVSFGNYLQWT